VCQIDGSWLVYKCDIYIVRDAFHCRATLLCSRRRRKPFIVYAVCVSWFVTYIHTRHIHGSWRILHCEQCRLHCYAVSGGESHWSLALVVYHIHGSWLVYHIHGSWLIYICDTYIRVSYSWFVTHIHMRHIHCLLLFCATGFQCSAMQSATEKATHIYSSWRIRIVSTHLHGSWLICTTGFQYSAMQSATEKAIYFYGYTYIVRSWKLFFGDLSTGTYRAQTCSRTQYTNRVRTHYIYVLIEYAYFVTHMN